MKERTGWASTLGRVSIGEEERGGGEVQDGKSEIYIQSYLSFCMASGQGVRLCIMGGYSFSGVCIPELYYIMCPIRASPPGLTLFVMVISRVIGVFSSQQWLFRFWRA